MKNKTILTFILLIFIFNSCQKNEKIFLLTKKNETKVFNVEMNLNINKNNLKSTSNLKSTQDTIPIEFFRVFKLKKVQSGSWVPYQKEDFPEGNAQDNFQDSTDITFGSSILIPYVLNINTRFAIKAMAGNKVLYYGISEKNYGDSLTSINFTMHFMQCKAELNFNIDDLRGTGFRYIFTTKYLKRNVNFEESNRTLPVTNGVEFPVYAYVSNGVQVNKVLMLSGDTTMLNGVRITDLGFFNIATYYGSGAPGGVSLVIEVLNGVDTILKTTITDNLIQLGKNHNLTFDHILSGIGNFTITDNNEVFKNISINTLSNDSSLKNGLIAWWNMRESNPITGIDYLLTNLQDQSGNENNLKNINSVFYPEKIQTYCGLVYKEFINETPNGYTFGMRINPSNLTSNCNYKLFGSWINNVPETILYFDGYTLKLQRSNSESIRTIDIGTFSNNEWVFIILDVNKTETKVYINGELVSSFIFKKNTNWTEKNTIIIGSYNYSGPTFAGYIKNSFIYNKSIPQTQIQTLNNNGAGLLFEELDK